MPDAYRILPYSDEIETVPQDEGDDIQRVLEAIEAIQTRGLAKSGKFRADVHVKTHGYVAGELRVMSNLPEELAQGLFERAEKYHAVVRFSNSASVAMSDVLPDGRGMAIKVLGVSGEMVEVDDQRGPTQDFIMINHPVFFARNVKEMLRLEQVLVEAGENPIAAVREAITGGDWNPLQWHWREMLTAARIAGHLPAHPASQTYFSMAPIRYGKYAAKYRAKPVGDSQDSSLELIRKLALNPDAMRLALEETLRSREIGFEIQVQLRTSQRMMPIEDPTIEWPESASPFRTVAYLSLPRREIAQFRDQEVYRSLSFNVWHALAAHRPLGGINRVRRRVYAQSAAWRRQGLGSPREDMATSAGQS